jgi:hypothetical protein
MRLQYSASVAALIIGLGVASSAAPVAAQAQISVGVNISVAPPLMPIYAQPPIPGDGYAWTPGYWARNANDYYWAPGVWVRPPRIGVLWTPPYWGFNNGFYAFNAGYWGPTVGFYGGVNYGFGYGGSGYSGGYWQGNHMYYNRSVNNFGDVRIATVYNRTVITNVSRVSYNGGRGGLEARPTPQEVAAAHEAHIAPTADQTRNAEMAANNPALRVSVNHGAPPLTAAARVAVVQRDGARMAAARDTNGRAPTAVAVSHRVASAHPAPMRVRTAAREAWRAPTSRAQPRAHAEYARAAAPRQLAMRDTGPRPQAQRSEGGAKPEREHSKL